MPAASFLGRRPARHLPIDGLPDSDRRRRRAVSIRIKGPGAAGAVVGRPRIEDKTQNPSSFLSYQLGPHRITPAGVPGASAAGQVETGSIFRQPGERSLRAALETADDKDTRLAGERVHSLLGQASRSGTRS